MSGIGDWVRKAENLARKHSKHVDKAVDKAEEMAKKRTGHKYDEQIGRGVDEVQRRYGGGGTAEPQRPARPEDRP
ncbi:antitoxin [Nonomuraea sp. ATR24]|uniref:antitoxin n=1 Tax=Nonomuraea TaxID=83681 RepID=UPI001C5FF798|nr:antitoxin [Nonomuraea ceibae]